MLSEFLLRRIAVTMHARALTSPQVRPTDEPGASSGSPEAVRVLLLGSGITSGWGVHTYGLALVGRLQQVLQERLKRPVDVEQISAVGATLSQAADMLGNRAAEEWDAIVVAFGLSDAMRLTPTRQWAQALDRLLAKLDGDMPQGLLVPVVIAGMAPTETIGLMTPIASIFRRQPERLNLLTRQAVERNRRTAFAPLPAMANSSTHPQGSSEAYRVWASAIADHLVPRLPHEVVRVGDPGTTPQPLGPLTAAILDARNTDVRDALQRTAKRLRAASDADLVLINLVNGDRLWSIADSTSGQVRSVPVSSTYCRATLGEDFVQVKDAARDPRFVDLASTVAHQYNAYAGVSLLDSDGRAVGTVSIYGGAASGDVDRAMLRRIGLEVESHLASVRSPRSGGAIFTPRVIAAPAFPNSAAAPVPLDDLDDSRAAAPEQMGDSTSSAPSIPGAFGRRVRLSTEGRQLTKAGALRPAPLARDFRIQGPDPIRLLLVGGEYAVGFGTTDRATALDGALARLMHIRTGRGVIVENRSAHLVALEQLASSLGPAGAHTFDLVVWAPTFVEAARLFLTARWITGISLMLRKIETTSDAAVVLVGIPSLLGVQPLAVIGRARAAQINRLRGRIASRFDDVLVVEPPAIVLSEVETVDGPDVYQRVAVSILPTAMQLLRPRIEPHASADLVPDASRAHEFLDVM